MALVILKALDWYEDMSRQSPGVPNKRAALTDLNEMAGNEADNSQTNDGSDHDTRLKIQSVLGKLYRVQELINFIAQCVKATSGENTLQSHSLSALPGQRPNDQRVGNGNVRPPLSAALLDQLIEDMRKRVRAVSSFLIDTLHHI